MNEQAAGAAIARTMAAAHEALDKDGLNETSIRHIQQALRELAATPALIEQVDLHRLHNSASGAMVLASEGLEGITLMMARFGEEEPTPVHDHGTWGVACVVSGQDRYLTWERLDDGQDPARAQIRVQSERILSPGDVISWLEPPHDIHSQQGSGGAAWELILFGRNVSQIPRHYFDPTTGSVDTRSSQDEVPGTEYQVSSTEDQAYRGQPNSVLQGPLVVVKPVPFNAESPIAALREPVTPTESFYVRSHFAVPDIQPDKWRLDIGGLVARPLSLLLDDLLAMPSRTVTATMECAGNGRIGFAPLPKGEPWGGGAVSTGVWQGVSLSALLERAGYDPAGIEVLFDGADSGMVEGGDSPVSFSRSLPLARALDPDTILAYRLNGQPLPSEHGGPVRLLVPDWYGVASVKWLVKITVLQHKFTGFYQADRYVMELPGSNRKEPLQMMRVKSTITSPSSGDLLPPGRCLISGVAWSGDGEITHVEVSTGPDSPWQVARLVGSSVPHAWRRWEYDWDETRTGRYVLRARATDSLGNSQPDPAEWNRLGYCNNGVQQVVIEIVGG